MPQPKNHKRAQARKSMTQQEISNHISPYDSKSWIARKKRTKAIVDQQQQNAHERALKRKKDMHIVSPSSNLVA